MKNVVDVETNFRTQRLESVSSASVSVFSVWCVLPACTLPASREGVYFNTCLYY